MTKITITGQLVKVSLKRSLVQTGGGKRGEVRGFSDASRKRLIEKMLTLDIGAMGMPLFVTLTYPKNYPTVERSKRDFKVWLARLRRFVGVGASALWRLELQRRGAPHYHLLLWGVDSLSFSWVAKSWYDVCGTGDEKHLAAGTRVERIRTRNGAIFYVSKYCAKVDDYQTVGRVWGFWGRKNLIFKMPEERLISDDSAALLKQIYVDRVQKLPDDAYGFSLYGSEIAEVARELV